MGGRSLQILVSHRLAFTCWYFLMLCVCWQYIKYIHRILSYGSSQATWSTIVYCSSRCRSTRLAALDAHFEWTILSLLKSATGTIKLTTTDEVEAEALKEWETKRSSMLAYNIKENIRQTAKEQPESNSFRLRDSRERCRQAARRLAALGQVEVVVGNKVVDASFVKGNMTLRLRK